MLVLYNVSLFFRLLSRLLWVVLGLGLFCVLSVFFSGEVFASRGGVIGHPWPRLSDAYAARKAQQFPGRPPLIRTGLMNRSFKHNAGRLSVEVLNEAWYFRFHQNGEGVPQRVMMDLDQKRVVQVAKFIGEDISKKMEEAHV